MDEGLWALVDWWPPAGGICTREGFPEEGAPEPGQHPQRESGLRLSEQRMGQAEVCRQEGSHVGLSRAEQRRPPASSGHSALSDVDGVHGPACSGGACEGRGSTPKPCTAGSVQVNKSCLSGALHIAFYFIPE